MTFPIDKHNFTSAVNSTSTLLTAGSTFTGAWEDASNYDSVVVAAATDQDGTYTIQFSPDGVNQDSTLTRYYRTGQINAPHRFTITRDYVRITFENTSASDQTYLRLQTTYGDKSELNAPLDGLLAQNFDAIATRPSDYDIEVADGLRQGTSLWNKFFYDSSLSTSSFELVWSNSGTWTRLPAKETIDFASTSVNDTNGGTGVNAIVIYGVGGDTDWEQELVEVLYLNGTTTVTTVNEYIGINRIGVFLSGTSERNEGVITGTATTAGTIQAEIPVDTDAGSVTQQGLFFVPEKHKFIGEYIWGNAIKLSGGGGDPVINIKGIVYSAVNNTRQEVFRANIDTVRGNFIPFPEIKFPVGEKSVLYFVAKSDKANTELVMRFGGKLKKDNDA